MVVLHMLVLLVVAGVYADTMADVREVTEDALSTSLETIENAVVEFSEGGTSDCEPLVDACGSDSNLPPFVDDPLFDIGKGVTFETALSLNAQTKTKKEKIAACAIGAVQDTWESNYDDVRPYGKWQYLATQSDGAFHMFPGPEDLDMCGTAFDPRGRWWYSMTTPKNLAIVVPWSTSISDEVRDRAKTAALDIIMETLTYLDHAFVVLYGDAEHYFISATLPVNATVRQSFAALFTTIPPFSTDGADVVTNNFIEGAQVAVERMKVSTANGAVSECKSAVILIAAGDMDASISSPSTDLLRLANARGSYGDAGDDDPDANEDDAVYYPILTYLMGRSKNDFFVKEIACENAGTFVQIPDTVDENDIIEYVVTYIEFFAAAITADKTQLRWSEPYVDGLGLGTVISACIPFFLREDANSLFLGVTCIDVKIDDVADAPDFEHVYRNDTDSMVANSRICPDARYGGQALENVRDSLSRFGDNSCLDKNSVGGGVYKVNKGDRVGLYFLGFTILAIMFWFLWARISERDVSCLIIFAMIAYIIGTALFWFISYEEIVDNENFVQTHCDIERVYDDPYRCCEIGNCECRNCFKGVDPSCGKRLGDLTEGPCCQGYHCCREECCRYCTRCSSTSSGGRSCSTYCCGHCCAESVNRRLCYSHCGTCHHLFTEVKVHIHGELFDYTQVSHCGLDKFTCVDAWHARWEEGSRRTCYYDKTTVPVGKRAGKVSLRVVFKEPDYDVAALFFAAFFWLIIVVILFYLSYLVARESGHCEMNCVRSPLRGIHRPRRNDPRRDVSPAPSSSSANAAGTCGDDGVPMQPMQDTMQPYNPDPPVS